MAFLECSSIRLLLADRSFALALCPLSLEGFDHLTDAERTVQSFFSFCYFVVSIGGKECDLDW